MLDTQVHWRSHSDSAEPPGLSPAIRHVHRAMPFEKSKPLPSGKATTPTHRIESLFHMFAHSVAHTSHDEKAIHYNRYTEGKDNSLSFRNVPFEGYS